MGHDVKAGDRVTLQWELGRDVSAASAVEIHIAPYAGGTPIVNRAATVDGQNGKLVSATLTSLETAIAGRYYVEIEATWPNGDVITFPGSGFEVLQIHRDLA